MPPAPVNPYQSPPPVAASVRPDRGEGHLVRRLCLWLVEGQLAVIPLSYYLVLLDSSGGLATLPAYLKLAASIGLDVAGASFLFMCMVALFMLIVGVARADGRVFGSGILSIILCYLHFLALFPAIQ